MAIDWNDKRLWAMGGVASAAILGIGVVQYRRARARVLPSGGSVWWDDTIPEGESVTSAKGDVYFPRPANSSQRLQNYKAAYQMVERAVDAGLWGGGDTLPNLAVVWAISESAGNPSACKRAEENFWGNGARGFYQQRPTSAYQVNRDGQPMQSVISEAQMRALCGNLPVTTALWLSGRRSQYSRLESGQQMNVIAARVGGAGGSYVSEFADGDYSRRPDAITRFKKAYSTARAKGFDLPYDWEDFALRPLPRKGSWPGRKAVGQIVGVPASELHLLQ